VDTVKAKEEIVYKAPCKVDPKHIPQKVAAR
jgi:hypothetical protein